MRKSLNRVLACFLSVALLVSCCISGLVLPAAASTVGQNLITNGDFEGAEWTDAKYVSGEGFGNSKAFKVTDNYTTLQNDFTLSKALDTNKWYVVRFKAKGGLAKLYDSTNSFMSMNPANTKQDGMDYTQGWIQYQLTPFKPASALTVIDTANLNFYVSVDNNATVYFDDFEIIEYAPA